VEPRHHGLEHQADGLEHQADACAQPRLSAFDTRLDRGLVSGNLPPAAIRNRSDDRDGGAGRRGAQHDALDALAYGINARKINWILDADISRFITTVACTVNTAKI
jgi:hypothetical protein